MSFVAGALFGLAIVLILNFLSAREKRQAKLRKYENVGGPIEVPVATIAKDLGPIFEPYVVKGTIIHIVGDGYYAYSPNQKYWLTCLNNWLSAGAEIKYILVDAEPEAISSLAPVRSRFADQFTVHCVSRNSENVRLANLARLFETLHPVLIETPAGNGMWLERFHPRSSCHSYHNRFVPPGKLQGEDLEAYRTYESYIAEILRQAPNDCYSGIVNQAA